MKKLIFFSLLFLLTYSSFGQTLEFYEKAIGHLKCRSCYYIPLTVESRAYSGKVVVDNYSLFSYLKSAKGFDEQTYQAFMLKLFQENRSLPIGGTEIDESGLFLIGDGLVDHSFRIVKPSQAFETISAQGCKKIIQLYFSPELPESETNKDLSCIGMIKHSKEDLLIRPRIDIQ